MVTQAKLTPTTRDLAQAGTLAGAILGALVGADPFDVRNPAAWVKDVDYFAIALWVAAVLLFLFAAAVRTDGRRGRPSEATSVWMALGQRRSPGA